LEFLGKTQGRFGKKKKKQESGRKKSQKAQKPQNDA
jgi:hypothetical protein